MATAVVGFHNCSKFSKVYSVYRPHFRHFSLSVCLLGKRNFRKFLVFNKRGSKAFREQRRLQPEHDLGVRPTGIWQKTNKKDVYYTVQEMIPELIVPDLTDFKLKPYVSYRVPDVVQSEFTPKDLFDACYADKILDDFKNNKLDENGDPLEPTLAEKQSPEEAWIKARQTGCDMFYEKLEENKPV